MTPADVVARLRAVDPALRSDEVVVQRRGDRIMASLPGGRIAWFATTPDAVDRLRAEDEVLRILGARCTFRVPTALAASPEGWSLRSTVPGAVDPDGFAARLKAEPALVLGVARTLAQALAEQHTRIFESDVVGWLPTVPVWPPPQTELKARLPHVVNDADLRRRIDRLLATSHDLGTGPRDRALVHSDLGLHNVAFDPATGVVNGVFDYGDSAWADRHLDFRYLVFAAVPDALLDAAMAAYRDATGVALDKRRILVFNAVAAVGHLSDRVGHAPDEAFAGRTLAGDLRWTRWALGRAGF